MSKIFYKGETLEITDDFIDVGYMAENVEVETIEKKALEIKRSHGDDSMTLLVSLPQILLDEAAALDKFLSAIKVPIHCYLILDQRRQEGQESLKKLQKLEVVFDSQEEFGGMYGTKIVTGSMVQDLCKSLFLISKEGAIFYVDMPENLEDGFDFERLALELNKAYVVYTGVGCHG
jgi:peroxiredoxin